MWYNISMKALLIIDMQIGVVADTPRFESEQVVARVNRLSALCRAAGIPVIFVRHDGTSEDYLFPDTPEWQLLPDLITAETDLYVTKTANDAFYRTELDALLRGRGIGELIVSGCATDFCVNATVHSALVKDYSVTVAADCHTTADRPGFSAHQLIAFHNWLWGALAPTKGKVEVVPLDAIEPRIAAR